MGVVCGGGVQEWVGGETTIHGVEGECRGGVVGE